MNLRSLLVLVVLATGFTWGVLHLFGVQFAGGDVYPEYSSLRTDPMGSRLLYESLSRLPGLTVTRNFMPLEASAESGATVLVLGIDPETFGKNMDDLRGLQAVAERGNRVVAAMYLPPAITSIGATKLNREWGVRLAVDAVKNHSHKLYFSKAEDWDVVTHAGPKTLTIERAFGNGSIVLMAESIDFTNQATVAMDRFDDVTAALGDHPRIIFDEEHFGLQESGSVVALARRFRLTGMAIGLAICAALWIWRNTASFPPQPPRQAVESLSGRTSRAGLVTLLRRHIPAKDLMSVCWQEWFATHRRELPAEQAARAREWAAALPPLAAAREIGNLVRRGPALPGKDRV